MSTEMLLMAEQSKTCPQFVNISPFLSTMILRSFWRSQKMSMKKLFAYFAPIWPFPRFLKIKSCYLTKLLGTHIELTLFDLCQILDLPDIGGHCYLRLLMIWQLMAKLNLKFYFAISFTSRNLGL